jgi:hypothetical protein
MYKQTLLATLTLLTTHLLVGQTSNENYQIYSAIISTEILDSTKSIAVLKNSIGREEVASHSHMSIKELKSSDANEKYSVYFWTENYKQERPTVIDSITTHLLGEYLEGKNERFVFTNSFNQKYKIYILKRFPINRNTVQADWKEFYEKYPGSGGIFSFSPIAYFNSNNDTAILYYWHRRNGFNGHGALAIMKKENGLWEMKYKIYLWWN